MIGGWVCRWIGRCRPDPAPCDRPHEQAIHDARNLRLKIRANAEIASRIAAKEIEKSSRLVVAAKGGQPSWQGLFGIGANGGEVPDLSWEDLIRGGNARHE